MFAPGPNAIAYAVLLLWPAVTLVLFKRLGPNRGLVFGLLGGYLLLPSQPAAINLPVLPPLDKGTVPSLAVLAICVVYYWPQAGLLPQNRLARLLLAALVLGPIFTVLTNLEPVAAGPLSLSGLRLIEVPSLVLGQLLLVAPYLLGRAYLGGEEAQRLLLWAILASALVYSLPMLLEVAVSPQVNTWVYGYFQHDFDQMIREGGFRPIVFLPHGLWAAFFALTALLAACALFRSRQERRKPLLSVAGAWMMGVLVLCKSLASLLYGLIATPLILFFSPRMQLRVAAMLAVLVLLYPIARGAHLVPVDSMVSLATSHDADRAQSLEFRFDNEEILLERALDKPIFGWGIWARNLVYDPVFGRAHGVTDGRWILVLGMFGWVGYLAEFGLLVLAVILAWWRAGPVPSPLISGLSLILALNLVDMIPNATLIPLTWLYAGALLGWAEVGRTATQPGAIPGFARQPAFRTIL